MTRTYVVRDTEHIWVDPDRCGGRPCLRGRRLTLDHVLGHIAAGMAIGEYCREYDVEVSLVCGALNDIALLLMENDR